MICVAVMFVLKFGERGKNRHQIETIRSCNYKYKMIASKLPNDIGDIFYAD